MLHPESELRPESELHPVAVGVLLAIALWMLGSCSSMLVMAFFGGR